jgi:DNA-binding SARP family transcriptional activator
MPPFQVRLFGEIQVVCGNRVLPSFPTRAAAELLAFLLMNRGHAVARDKLAGHLWGERTDQQARKALRTGLWQVRSHLESVSTGDAPLLRADRDRVLLENPDRWWVDLWAFEDQLEAACVRSGTLCTPEDAERLQEALELHRRPFLEAVDARWCESQRERARLLWLTGLEALVRWHRARRDTVRGLFYALDLLRVDPYRESMHREVMALHYLRGDRPSALLQYERCRALLRDELGISPMAPTHELRQAILDGRDITDPHGHDLPRS